MFSCSEGDTSVGSDSSNLTKNSHGGPHPALQGPRREMLVAGGKDLQERKRLLVDRADALIVLPGGPGTWDEVSFECTRRNRRVSGCIFLKLL